MVRTLKPIWGVLFIVALVFTVYGVAGMLRARPQLIPWGTDLDAARVVARDRRQPVLVYFTASWCPPCRKMQETTWADVGVERAMRPFVPVKIDVDQQRRVMDQFEITSIPTMIVMAPDGGILKSATGGMSPTEMARWLADVPGVQSPVPWPNTQPATRPATSPAATTQPTTPSSPRFEPVASRRR